MSTDEEWLNFINGTKDIEIQNTNTKPKIGAPKYYIDRDQSISGILIFKLNFLD